MQKSQVRKFEREGDFFKTAIERQDFFMVYDGALWRLYQYIAIEIAIYGSGSESSPDLLLLNLGGGHSVEIHGRSLFRVLHAFQGRLLVSLEPGEAADMAIVDIEAVEKTREP